jgi:hypothetical protein
MPAFDSPSVTRRRFGLRRSLGLGTIGASALSWAATFGLILAGVKGPPVGWAMLAGLATMIVGPQLLVSGSPALLGRRGSPARVTVGADGVRIERQGEVRHIAPGEVEGGWREHHGDEHFALLRLRRGEVVSIGVPDADAAEQLLTACGASEQARAVALSVPRVGAFGRRAAGCALPATAFTLLCGFIGVAVDLGRQPTVPGPLVGMLITLLLGGLAMRWMAGAIQGTSVVVGTDGVVVHRPWHRQTFLSYAELTEVEVAPPVLSARAPHGLESRPAVVLRARGRSPVLVPAATLDDANALSTRIHAAMTAGAGAEPSALETSLLERQGREVPAWKEQLASLLSRRASYRDRACDAAQLAALCESPRETPERRAAAAVALGASQDPAVQQRLRIAAEGCANPKLRIALEAAAERSPIEDDTLEQLSRESAESSGG